ncbi:MAG: carbon storage regulator [Pirellulaceae bacterium]
MLILSRRESESICLGDDIELTIMSVGTDKVRIGVKAPPEVRILRNELEVQQQTIPFPVSDPARTEQSPAVRSPQRKVA